MIKRDKIIIGAIGGVMLLIAGVFCYGLNVKQGQRQVIKSYEHHVTKNSSAVTKDMKAAVKYNENSRDKDTKTTDESLKAYDDIFASNDGMIGVLTISKINLRLPVYHGTDDSTLSKGIGHVDTTAFPMDTKGTKSVLTGHNGVLGADTLFTRLDELDTGDRFMMQIGDVTYHYRVTQMITVTPDQADAYTNAIVGDDKSATVTLVTCTPYGLNTHRLLVVGEFVKKVTATENYNNEAPQTRYSMGKETIFCIIIEIVGAGLIGWIIYQSKQQSKSAVVEGDDYAGYEVDDEYWDE